MNVKSILNVRRIFIAFLIIAILGSVASVSAADPQLNPGPVHDELFDDKPVHDEPILDNSSLLRFHAFKDVSVHDEPILDNSKSDRKQVSDELIICMQPGDPRPDNPKPDNPKPDVTPIKPYGHTHVDPGEKGKVTVNLYSKFFKYATAIILFSAVITLCISCPSVGTAVACACLA